LPYHNKYKDVPSACGVAFATENGFINPSLKIIFKELSRSGYSIYGNPVVQGKKLIDWCNQGVLLLNTALTVEEGKPGSHSKLWSRFTNSFIATLSREKRDLVWLLMGKHAQVYKENIISGEVIETVHPMVDVYGGKNVFVGSNVFIQINDILTRQNKTPIDWGCKPEGYE
jgi:uracil-DNA glycosylase